MPVVVCDNEQEHHEKPSGSAAACKRVHCAVYRGLKAPITGSAKRKSPIVQGSPIKIASLERSRRSARLMLRFVSATVMRAPAKWTAQRITDACDNRLHQAQKMPKL
jgi:hypothetical protein